MFLTNFPDKLIFQKNGVRSDLWTDTKTHQVKKNKISLVLKDGARLKLTKDKSESV